MKILITGATGLVGQEIVSLCHQLDIDVNYLTTNKDKITSDPKYQGYYWDPEIGEIDTDCFKDVEVIINLAGATVAKRWTSSYKRKILESRTHTTSLIFDSLKRITNSVRHVISASAIGIYPDSFQNYYMEDARERDQGFLGQVVSSWEDTVMQFEELGVKVSILRIGLVLSNKGGAFLQIVQPIRYGFGAFFGNGKQWQSWIHVEDLARMFVYVLQEEMTGVFNAVAPNPISNRKLINTIATRLNKRILLPSIPRFVMKLMLGEMHSLLFSSQRVCCNKLLEKGFVFNHDNIASATDDLL
ncbi:TIGR01777 family oxidoreductase [Aquimarina sp. 2201CG1-2-11]|uniref:TIGR01777 family oxidoreductase n=1 Tax=Aquimarina discodermiae TaxID=3231043 RepID=UPI003462C0A4